MLKVSASQDIALGTHALEGEVVFQAMENGKLSALQRLPVTVPITVGQQDARMDEESWPFRSHVGEKIENVLLFPIELPAFLILYIACNTGKGCDL